MLGLLASSVAHQVLNPLTTLVSGLPAMRARLQGVVSATTYELIDLMIECAARIERLTRDLVDLSRVDREAQGLFRPSDGLRSSIRLLKGRLVGRVACQEQVEDSDLFYGRAADLNHVFMNLLDNAYRAVSDAGKIQVRGAREGGSYVVSIEDSGTGIDAESAEIVFEPFYTTRPAGEGSGLGLTIAREAVRRYLGDITVARSELGGAAFRVTIPTPQVPPSLVGNLDGAEHFTRP
jgi:signal transduction histidine kinase